MTLKESVNRSYNLMITAVLMLAGIGLGSDALSEADLADKADDTLLFLIGIAAVIWYKWGRHRFQRTWITVALAGLALVVQITALFIEHDDSAAVGDNIGGMFLFVSFFIYAIVQWVVDKRTLARLPDTWTTEHL